MARKQKKSASETMKAAYIGAIAVLIAAVIAGLFAFFSNPPGPKLLSTQGDCSGIITGDIQAPVNQNCTSED